MPVCPYRKVSTIEVQQQWSYDRHAYFAYI
jgi:hypothetical protein